MIWEQRAAQPCLIFSHRDEVGVGHWDFYPAHIPVEGMYDGFPRHHCSRCGGWLEDIVRAMGEDNGV